MVNAPLTQNTSVYDLVVEATDIVPTDDETAEILLRLEREHTAEEIEHKVSRWFQSTCTAERYAALKQWPASYSGNLSSTGPLVSLDLDPSPFRPVMNVRSPAIWAATLSGGSWPVTEVQATTPSGCSVTHSGQRGVKGSYTLQSRRPAPPLQRA